MRIKIMTREAMVWLWSLDTRTAEWVIANVFIGRAVAMWLPGDAHALPLYNGFKSILPNDFLWGLLYFIIGIVPWVAILWNGRYKRSPAFRATAATLAAAVLAMMAVVFAQASSLTASALYGSLAISAIYCVLNIAAKSPRTLMETLKP